ncbi:MAG: NAD(+)/NADH kinase [Lachnospiraceae bacterium]|nr:NAD(+)/NADH kinase [Lachnospiraceae bacterium]
MNRFFIASNELKDRGHAQAAALKTFIESKGAYVADEPASLGSGFGWQIPEDTDCLIVLGGDGTMLRAARNLKNKKIPILGINLGHLGYLTAGDKDSAKDTIEQVLAGRCVIEERIMLRGSHLRGKEVLAEDLALNDVTVTRNNSLKTINLRLRVNGEPLYRYRADGIIISTPTGSTAYNLSCGGPIVEPTADLLLVTPIAPHSLNNRSLILSSQDVIELELLENDDPDPEMEYSAYFDGESKALMMPGDRIRIVRAPEVTRILKLSDRSFLDTLRKKMTI